jgi:hypothetical protein
MSNIAKVHTHTKAFMKLPRQYNAKQKAKYLKTKRHISQKRRNNANEGVITLNRCHKTQIKA